MAEKLGTRVKQTFARERIDQGRLTRSVNRDPGMTKNVSASMTFGGGNVSAANGTFTGFAVMDPVLVVNGGVNNGGFFRVTAIDGANHSFLTLNPPPKAEGPISTTVRTP